MTDSDYQDYVNKSVFLLKQLKRVMLSHNNMLSVSASTGDVVSASMMLNQNVMISGIDTVLLHVVASTAKEDKVPEVDESRLSKETLN